jgi:hypothetical protein
LLLESKKHKLPHTAQIPMKLPMQEVKYNPCRKISRISFLDLKLLKPEFGL